MTDFVDGYCERVAPGLWGEPLNSLTSLAFLVAAVLVWRLAAGDRTGRLLAALLGLVFAAGTAFHLLATRWAAVADSAAFLAFATVFATAFARRWFVGPAFLAVTALSAAFGGGLYLPALGGLFAIAAVLAFLRDADWTHYAVAAAIFALALSLRTIDLDVCGDLPAGTHFLWHLLTAVVLYLVSRTLLTRLRQDG